MLLDVGRENLYNAFNRLIDISGDGPRGGVEDQPTRWILFPTDVIEKVNKSAL